MKTIGFIGTGVMGKSMAGHLLKAGHRLHVYTRTKEKARDLLTDGAVWEDAPGSLAARCDLVITIVGMPSDVEQVYFEEGGLLANLRKGTVLIDMTTSSPELAGRIADAAKKKGGAALDAPVSGGDKGAREAGLSIMVGGDRHVYDEVLPVFKLMGRNIVYQGPAGSGQSCKMCNQVVIASTMLGVCEAMAYAKKSGLDPHTVLESISAGAAGSWALSNLAPRMIEGDFDPGFYVKHFIKDMGIASESAEKMDLDLPGLALSLKSYRELAAKGDGDLGTQALAKMYGVGPSK
ncbi:MAG: NAD(P)-dependent oxidoreductase [Verrucomicrobia bacterium]|nr:NAD(P)-dependent oxidoreductase [Verrucomicrobiota bacterium]MCH8526853.1 NAD(P)-dependent oxidoreductase [Kiritimatiellia bacterium]